MAKIPLPVLPYWSGPLSHPFYSKVIKRLLDFFLALAALPLALAVMAPISLWVRLDSKGPALYQAPRGGYHNKPFYILKFRTMVTGADRHSGTTALNDSRITKAGRFLRKTKLDELPQLFNVLKGEMSFIGPRPELLKYTTAYTKEEECILWVRPGISDASSLAYINLDEQVGSHNPEENYEAFILPKKNALRAQYAKSQSLLVDTRLFFQTLSKVFIKLIHTLFSR